MTFTLTIGFLLLISVLVTAIGSNTVLAAKTPSSQEQPTIATSDSPNAVTSSAVQLVGGAKNTMLSVGTFLYGTCRSITNGTAQVGDDVVHGSASVVRGTVDAAIFAGSRVAGGVMLVLHLPGKAIHSVANGSAVSAIIQPSAGQPVPVINNETSAAAIARLSAQQQQEIASLVAGQLAANRTLGGTIVAGDPRHGGYPAGWDNAAQDSLLDSWGMYNRECVSYAAWKVYQTYGHMPYWGGVGNANQWVRDARSVGIPTGSIPKVHSVAISMRGYYGHAMWVEAVNGDMVYVSQYNYDLHGHYSEMWVNANYFTYIYFQ